MKYRLDFVTNSSSSSYTCDICGHTDSGWDIGISECGMFECEEGHILCTRHAKPVETESLRAFLTEEITNSKSQSEARLIAPPEERPSWFSEENERRDLAKYIKLLEELPVMDKNDMMEIARDYYSWDCERPSAFCPLCQLEAISSDDVLLYLAKKHNVSKASVLAEVKEMFGSYADFKRYLRNEDKK